MARNRQRAKQRQAERRARQGQSRPGQPRASEPPVSDPRVPEPSPGIDPDLAVGAPPQDEGRSDTVVADEPVLDDDEHLTEDEVLEELDEEKEEGYAPQGRRGTEARERKHRSRVVQFLIASWAELQRVQWPDRKALTTLTGVVLGFVLIAGGYLGLLDAIVSRIIKAIL
jgi:preprotein translocase subunit SecE